MSDSTYDWTRFERRIFINADPDEVFLAWAIPANIVKWFIAEARCVSADDVPQPANDIMSAGDTYFWEWHQDLRINGTILDVVPNEKLVFTFGDKEPGSNEKIIVTVDVSAVDEGVTLLRLVQENMADTPQAHVSWHMQCNLGWSFFMTNLKGLLEYGVDLRETDCERAYEARAVTH